MHKSRLLELYRALEKTEQRELGKFVRSPVFNQRKDVTDLYDYLYLHCTGKDEQALERTRIFATIFPNEAFDSAKFDYTMSFLFAVIKQYLVFKEREQDPVGEGILLARSLRRKNLGRLFEKEVNTLEKSIENQPLRDAEYHYNNFRLHVEKHSFAKQESRTSMASFAEFSESLTQFYIAKKLWEACTLVTHQAVAKVDYTEQAVIAAVLGLVEQNGYREVPAVNLYYHCYKALTETDSLRWFEALRSLIRSQHGSMPPSDVLNLYLVSTNYCIRRSNNGEKAFLAEAFQLYKEGLATAAFLENNLLNRFNYNNIVMAGLLLKEFDWVEEFLHEYKDFIEPKHRESTFNYNLAMFYFQKPDYERAMDLLQRVEFDDVMHNLSARRILLRIYFEKDEREALNSLITSFKNFLYRHKELGTYHRNMYMNLLRFSRRLLTTPTFEHAAREELKAEIRATEPLAEKNWLLEFLERAS
ncbi:MAG: hypothetical protein IT258_20060 [Saprospiraceae bacterium]|nr:hypothetical protein [Saprospiraceae bacterium]